MQIVILIIILLCLILYFFDVLGSEDYNFENNSIFESNQENIKNIKNLSDDDYVAGLLNTILNFDQNKFQIISCKVLVLIFKYISKNNILKLKDLLSEMLLKDIKSSIVFQDDISKATSKAKKDSKRKIALIAENPKQNDLLNNIIFNSSIDIKFKKYINVHVEEDKVEIISAYQINNCDFIFTFMRLNKDDNIWLLKSIK